MECDSVKRNTQGRRKIEMKKIGSKKNLLVTFTKRRQGLFGKAGELAAVCDSKIAILVQSPSNKFFAFGYPSVESVIHKYETAGTYNYIPLQGDLTDVKSGYFEAFTRLEKQKRVESMAKGTATGNINGKFWWDEEIEEGMELHDLEEYVEALEKLLERVRVREMEVAKESNDSVGLPSQNTGLGHDAFLDQIDYFMKISEGNDAQKQETVRHVWHFDDDLWGWKTS